MSIAGELSKLWRAGAYTLPEAAAKYGESGEASDMTGTYDESAWLRTTVDGNPRKPIGPDQADYGTSLGKLQPQWTTLRDTLQNRIIHKTRENLVNAGEALMQLADDYANDDQAARTAIDDMKKKYEVDNPGVPEAPTHKTPKPKDDYDSPSDYSPPKP